MKLFELSNILEKINGKTTKSSLGILRKKGLWYGLFIALVTGFYFTEQVLSPSTKRLEEKAISMDRYDRSLKMNVENTMVDSAVSKKEKEQLLYAIEDKIVKYLYEIPDYSYVSSLKTYLRYSPKLLDEIPSCVPLEKGEYGLSSSFGYRIHPISGKKKKHLGLDFSAPKGKHVYATASGKVIYISHSNTGYGIHIIIRHRFGFRTLYGHLTKVVVTKGQFIKQHELIGTVGNSGNSTGNHLHYEIIKNSSRVDPVPSLNLKRNILLKLIK